MTKRSEQEGPEPAFFTLNLGQVVLFQKTGEKRLREILGILWAIPLAAYVGVKWIPIEPAQLFESFSGLWRRLVACSQYDRPMSGDEPILLQRRLILIVVREGHDLGAAVMSQA